MLDMFAPVNGREIADYRPLTTGHNHTLDLICGYVVRETIHLGVTLWHGPQDEHDNHAHCGYDVAVYDGADAYAKALSVAYNYREQPGGYAVVDRLYTCGCRS